MNNSREVKFKVQQWVQGNWTHMTGSSTLQLGFIDLASYRKRWSNGVYRLVEIGLLGTIYVVPENGEVERLLEAWAADDEVEKFNEEVKP